MNWEVVIGLETHAQLSTASKIFSGASTAFGAAPNTQASAVDIALPGVLPVLNKGAVERAIRFGLAVGATIAPKSVFARKNYFYPDLPKGYQISQYEIPVVQGGGVDIVSPTRGAIRVNLTRAHLEEDAGKSLHEDFHGMTGIDLNRAGTPLLEIVTEPDLRSSDEAVAYAKALHGIVRWIGICDGNMQEGSFRCDANVSVRREGAPLGTRCEIKNLNSFRFMQQAIDFEVRRQIALIEDGGAVVQETRLWDPDRNETRSMRSKEDAQDYRYFPDPDLPPLAIDRAWIEHVKAAMPELPRLRGLRFSAHSVEHLIELAKTGTAASRPDVAGQVVEHIDPELQKSLLKPTYGLASVEASALIDSMHRADYFEKVVSDGIDAKIAAGWVLGEVAAALNRDGMDFDSIPLQPVELAQLLGEVQTGVLSKRQAKEAFSQIWDSAKSTRARIVDAGRVVAEGTVDVSAMATILSNLRPQVSDETRLNTWIEDAITTNPKLVMDYKSGNKKAANALVGAVMKLSSGTANPNTVSTLLKTRLSRE